GGCTGSSRSGARRWAGGGTRCAGRRGRCGPTRSSGGCRSRWPSRPGPCPASASCSRCTPGAAASDASPPFPGFGHLSPRHAATVIGRRRVLEGAALVKNSSRRIVASGALTLALAPAFGLAAAPAHADVELEVVAEGITESGYYVDSKAKYYGSDGAQELLRQAQGRSVPVFVAILPAGNDAGQVLQQLPALMERKGTYAVLAGDQLRVSSNSLPDSQVKAAYRKAVQNSKGKPDLALLRFVQTLPESKYAPPKPGRPGNDGRPAPETPPAK